MMTKNGRDGQNRTQLESVDPLLIQLGELQERILEWLRPEQRSDEIAGARLWSDVVAFVEMLRQVNRRQELLAHDAHLVAQLVGLLEAAQGSQVPSLPGLQRLEGLDEALDAALVGQPSDLSSPELRDALRALAGRLGIAGRITA